MWPSASPTSRPVLPAGRQPSTLSLVTDVISRLHLCAMQWRKTRRCAAGQASRTTASTRGSATAQESPSRMCAAGLVWSECSDVQDPSDHRHVAVVLDGRTAHGSRGSDGTAVSRTRW